VVVTRINGEEAVESFGGATTALTIKCRLEEIWGIPPEEQRLIGADGQVLADAEVLAAGSSHRLGFVRQQDDLDRALATVPRDPRSWSEEDLVELSTAFAELLQDDDERIKAAVELPALLEAFGKNCRPPFLHESKETSETLVLLWLNSVGKARHEDTLSKRLFVYMAQMVLRDCARLAGSDEERQSVMEKVSRFSRGTSGCWSYASGGVEQPRPERYLGIGIVTWDNDESIRIGSRDGASTAPVRHAPPQPAPQAAPDPPADPPVDPPADPPPDPQGDSQNPVVAFFASFFGGAGSKGSASSWSS
jgi:hypothetical protein